MKKRSDRPGIFSPQRAPHWIAAAFILMLLYLAAQFFHFEKQAGALLSEGREPPGLNHFPDQLLDIQLRQLNSNGAVDSSGLGKLTSAYETLLIETDLSGMPENTARFRRQFRHYRALLAALANKDNIRVAERDSLSALSMALFHTLKSLKEQYRAKVEEKENAFLSAREAFYYRAATALAFFLLTTALLLTAWRARQKDQAQKIKRSLKSLHDGSGFIEFTDDRDDLFAALAIEFNHIKKRLDAYESYPLPELILGRPAAGKLAVPFNMGLMVLDKNGGRVLRFSPSIPRLLQAEPSQSPIPVPVNVFLQHSPYRSRLQEITAQNGRTEILRNNKGGLLALTTLKYSDGIYVMVQDLSFLKIQELARKEFIAYISHEIKTPLTSMSLAVHNLQSAHSAERLDEIRLLLKDDLFRLEQFTKNMLLIAMLDEDGHIPEKENSDLSLLLRQAVGELARIAEKKQITVKVTTRETQRANINPVLIRHALLNILHNALRFGPARSTVRIVVKEEKSWLTLEVHDQGPGLEAGLLRKINEGRLRYTLKNDQGEAHFGLGLYLSARIIERHGGHFSIDNGKEGACVTLRLPREETHE